MTAEPHPESKGRAESKGREDNAAVADAPGTSEVRPANYPSTRADDSVEGGEPRSFEPANPQPRQGAGDSSAPADGGKGHQGPAGDPAEGKR